GWPDDPEPGESLAREVRARDGRNVLQIRIELGVLQRVHGGGANLAIVVSAVGNWFDRHVVDVASDGFARAGQGLSKVFRRLQTGILEEYALVFAIGLILLLLFFLFVTGVYTAI
ncbi:MAG: hypothetical protein JRN42_04650, partial [Nitrososphaerota archaeon]|nr:hypothetical protein [Nitrososphaerota archaeon]